MPCILKNIKLIIKKLNSFIKSLTFSFRISYDSNKHYFLKRIIMQMFEGLVPIINVFLAKEIINNIVNAVNTNADVYYTLSSNIILLFIVNILNGIVSTYSEVYANIHKDIITNYINVQINSKVSSLDMSFFDSPYLYNELINVRRDSQAIQTLTWFAVSFIRFIMQFSISISVLAGLHWIFPVLLLIFAIPSIIIEKKFIEYSYSWIREMAPEERKMNYIQEIITRRDTAKDMRLFNLFDAMISRYNFIWKHYFYQKKKITTSKGKWLSLCSVFPQFVLMAIYFYTAILIIHKVLTIGDFGLYIGIAGQVTNSLHNLINLGAQIYDNDLKISRFKEFLSWEPCLMTNGSLKPSLKPTIEFVNVSFRYPNTSRYILKNLNLKLIYGEKIALIGLNGAGKSTLIKLLLRFYDPSEGSILMDGTDIREYDLNELRKVFGVLFQDFFNYAFRVSENVALSNLSLVNDERKILNACIMSGADKIVNRLTLGVETYLTKQFDYAGEELSGGEWQKIALARTFFRDSPIMILDEPSSALDPEAEDSAFKKISELSSGKTTIFISHRLSTVTMADKVLLLENGKIIENGSHHELMNAAGKYAYLFNLQARRYTG